MKGFVFRFGAKRAARLPSARRAALSVRGFIRRRGAQSFFAVLFFMGLAVGAACGGSFDDDILDRLDYLFVTNISARLSMSAFGIFSSCFVSYFVFIFALFLFALSAWGFVCAPLLSVFKGFSVGISSAFIFAEYRASGIGFYILVVLPGAVMFLFTLIRYSRESFRLSLEYARLSVFGRDKAVGLYADIRAFLKKSLLALLFSGGCAVADMLLWVLFADKFHFK